VYIWPRSIRRQIDRGEIDAFDRLAKLRKAPLFGYVFIFLAIGDLLGTRNQIGLFDDSVLAAVGFFAFAIVILAFWIVWRRKIDQLNWPMDLTKRCSPRPLLPELFARPGQHSSL
jgi:hypothetical protein